MSFLILSLESWNILFSFFTSFSSVAFFTATMPKKIPGYPFHLFYFYFF